MARYLIVANQTLGGEALDQRVRDRIQWGDSEFYIVVPMTPPKHETSAWTRGFPVGDMAATPNAIGKATEEEARIREAVLDEARRRAEHRLGRMLEKIRSAGGNADGTVGDADPTVAVKQILDNQSFDEVIISTLPSGISRWLKMDLPSRVARLTDAPVTTIEAEL